MRKSAFILSLLLATVTATSTFTPVQAATKKHAPAVAAAPVDEYDVKWHVLGAVLTFVVASALMPWALQDLDASVARANAGKPAKGKHR